MDWFTATHVAKLCGALVGRFLGTKLGIALSDRSFRNILVAIGNRPVIKHLLPPIADFLHAIAVGWTPIFIPCAMPTDFLERNETPAPVYFPKQASAEFREESVIS